MTPKGFDLKVYARHPEASVRREALRSLIKDAGERDDAITTALADPDERIVRMALGGAMSNCPPKAAKTLLSRADDTGLSADLRALGIRAASSDQSASTLAFLVARTTGKRRFLRKHALAAATPEMLAALAGLATHWSSDSAAQKIIAIAAESTDKDIRDAVARRVPTTRT